MGPKCPAREKKKAKSAAMQQSAEALSKDAAEIQALRVENMVLQVSRVPSDLEHVDCGAGPLCNPRFSGQDWQLIPC